MTRIPELERELVLAAGRRRRGPAVAWPRVLVPAVAVLLVVFVAGSMLRGADPEVEAPAGQAKAVTLEELRRGPLAPALDQADPAVAPAHLAVEEWRVGAFVSRGGLSLVCLSAITAGGGMPEGPSCASPGFLSAAVTRDHEVQVERARSNDSRVLYGLVAPDAETVEVRLGEARGQAKVDERLFTATITERERRAVQLDGGEVPTPGPVSFRLFAVVFTAEELPDPDAVSGSVNVTYASGDTSTSPVPIAPARDPEPAPAGCYEKASLNANTAVPGGEGDPVEVCRRFWDETGFAGTPTPKQLTACEGKGSAPWVFPGGPGTCERLGLEPFYRG